MKSLSGEEKLQAIYDAEQHFRLDWFWDAGISVSFWDEDKGHFGNVAVFETVKEAIDWAYEKLVK